MLRKLLILNKLKSLNHISIHQVKIEHVANNCSEIEYILTNFISFAQMPANFMPTYYEVVIFDRKFAVCTTFNYFCANKAVKYVFI